MQSIYIYIYKGIPQRSTALCTLALVWVRNQTECIIPLRSKRSKGSWDSSVVEHQTRDQKVHCSSQQAKSWQDCSFPGSTVCADPYFGICSTAVYRPDITVMVDWAWNTKLLTYPPRVTALAHKRSWPFCQKCKWQVTAKHTCNLCMWLGMKWHCELLHGCMVYTAHALRWQQFYVAPAM